MKNMVSGRKSDRNRKNIVFGKIPKKILVVEKFFRSSKFFRLSKIFRSSSRKIFLTQQNIFRSKIFSTSKKNVDRFCLQSFFFVQKQVSDNFFFYLIFTCKILTAQMTMVHGRNPLCGFGAMLGREPNRGPGICCSR